MEKAKHRKLNFSTVDVVLVRCKIGAAETASKVLGSISFSCLKGPRMDPCGTPRMLVRLCLHKSKKVFNICKTTSVSVTEVNNARKINALLC